MNLNNFTIKSQEAVQQAQQIAMGYQQQAIELDTEGLLADKFAERLALFQQGQPYRVPLPQEHE